MGSEPGSPSEVGQSMPPPIQAPAPRPKRRHSRLAELAVGAAVSFLVLALLNGPSQAAMLVGLVVVCTAGIALIPILFVSWIVGWVVFALWDGARKPSPAAPIP